MVASKGKFIVCILGLMILSILSLGAQGRSDLLNRKVSIEVTDAPISKVIPMLADASGSNIVLALDSEGETKETKYDTNRITLKLTDVPIEQALSLVVKSVGLSYRLIGDNIFLVGEKSRIEEEVGERSYIVSLNYIDAEQISKALAVMPGQIELLEGQNAFLVRANPETFAELVNRLEEIDRPQAQIEIRARLIEISLSESEKYGIDWSRLDHLTTILAEDPSSVDGFGLPYNYADAESKLSHGDPTDFAKIPEEQYFQKMDDWEDVGNFSRQLYAFDVTIDWLLENNAAKLLTDTRLTAMNGQEADIHIGEIVPFVVQSVQQDYEYQVEREEVGIKLQVKPKVNSDGQITTTISPEVSSVVELVGGFVPRTKTRKVNSTVTVPNGSRIIVGGLLSSEIKKNVNKLPFLGDLPYVGRFFRHTYETVETTDLIIEITPRIVEMSGANTPDFEIDERLERRLIKPKSE